MNSVVTVIQETYTLLMIIDNQAVIEFEWSDQSPSRIECKAQLYQGWIKVSDWADVASALYRSRTRTTDKH